MPHFRAPHFQSSANLDSPHGAASAHLDALRGVAAIGVCLSHLRDLFFRDYPQLPHHTLLLALVYFATGLGRQWVIIFFVLSGYLVGGSVLRAHAAGRWMWSSYLFNRLTRLYIVLVPALVFGGILDATGLHLFGMHGIYGGHASSLTIAFLVRDRLSIPILIGNYVFLQTIIVPTLGSNGPLWSLANEFWYYIAFPAAIFCILPRVKLPFRLLHLALLVAVLLLVGQQIAVLGLVWLMGVAIHFLPRISIERTAGGRFLIVGGIVILALTLAWSKQTRSAARDYILGVVVTLLIYVIIGYSRTPMPKLYTAVAQRISHSSYTLYLAHVPMLVFMAAFLETRYGIHRWLPDALHTMFGTGLFLAVMLYAQIVWFLFEKRTDALRARLKPLFFGRH